MVWKAFILVSLLTELNLIIQDLDLAASIKTLSERFFHSTNKEKLFNWRHQKLVSCQDYISLHSYYLEQQQQQKNNISSFWVFNIFFPKFTQRQSRKVYHRTVRVKMGEVPVPCQLLLCPSLSTWLAFGDCSIFLFFYSMPDSLKSADTAQSLKGRNPRSENAKLSCDSEFPLIVSNFMYRKSHHSSGAFLHSALV